MIIGCDNLATSSNMVAKTKHHKKYFYVLPFMAAKAGNQNVAQFIQSFSISRPKHAEVYTSTAVIRRMYLDDVLCPVFVLVGLRLERLQLVPQGVHLLQHVRVVDLYMEHGGGQGCQEISETSQ